MQEKIAVFFYESRVACVVAENTLLMLVRKLGVVVGESTFGDFIIPWATMGSRAWCLVALPAAY
jgi:hypothetical protein